MVQAPVLYRMWLRVVAALGFRGAALLIFGSMYIGIGVGIPASPPPPPELFYSAWPIWLRCTIWIGTGSIALLGAVIQAPRWQRLGYGLLFFAPLERCGAYAMAMFTDLDWSVQLTVANSILAALLLVAVATVRLHLRSWIQITALALLLGSFIVTVLAFANLRWASGVAIYSLICAIVALISGWPEPEDE